MALTSGGHLQLAVEGHLFTTAGGNVDTGAGGNYTVTARNSISLFVATQDMKLYAGKGKVEVQAQGDAMSLLADRDVQIASMNEKVNIAAAKELVLECGGAFIQLKDGSVTIGGPLDLFIKAITIQKQGKAQMNVPMPVIPVSKGYSRQFVVRNRSGISMPYYPYRIEMKDGQTWYGRTDEHGKTERIWTANPQNIALHPHEGLLPGEADENDDDDDCCDHSHSTQD